MFNRGAVCPNRFAIFDKLPYKLNTFDRSKIPTNVTYLSIHLSQSILLQSVCVFIRWRLLSVTQFVLRKRRVAGSSAFAGRTQFEARLYSQPGPSLSNPVTHSYHVRPPAPLLHYHTPPPPPLPPPLQIQNKYQDDKIQVNKVWFVCARVLRGLGLDEGGGVHGAPGAVWGVGGEGSSPAGCAILYLWSCE